MKLIRRASEATAQPTGEPSPASGALLSREMLGQIYLRANALLREPLRVEHLKPRLLGHWGTTPGLNFVYAHMNQVIRDRHLNVLFVAGNPGRWFSTATTPTT